MTGPVKYVLYSLIYLKLQNNSETSTVIPNVQITKFQLKDISCVRPYTGIRNHLNSLGKQRSLEAGSAHGQTIIAKGTPPRSHPAPLSLVKDHMRMVFIEDPLPILKY